MIFPFKPTFVEDVKNCHGWLPEGNIVWVKHIETRKCLIDLPIGSMYGIYGNIYHQDTPNVSIYTIHGSYGNIIFDWLNHWDSSKCLHHSYSLFITGILHWVVWSTHLMTYTRLHGTFRFSTLDLSLRRACAYIIISIYIYMHIEINIIYIYI